MLAMQGTANLSPLIQLVVELSPQGSVLAQEEKIFFVTALIDKMRLDGRALLRAGRIPLPTPVHCLLDRDWIQRKHQNKTLELLRKLLTVVEQSMTPTHSSDKDRLAELEEAFEAFLEWVTTQPIVGAVPVIPVQGIRRVDRCP